MLCDREGAIADGSKVYDTCNHLEMYKEDLARESYHAGIWVRLMSVMKSYGANTYRFSLAWARIIPLGGRDDPINEKGVAFYNSVIDECLKLGMTPFITLYQCVSSQQDVLELMK
jgi:beta-glucosidase